MMKNDFEEFIEKLGDKIDLPLHVDELNCCSLMIDDDFIVQIEEDRENNILIFSNIAEILPGKFRENTLKMALKRNNKPFQLGTLSYNDKDSNLVFFQFFELAKIDISFFLLILEKFIEIADSLKKAILSGNIHDFKN